MAMAFDAATTFQSTGNDADPITFMHTPAGIPTFVSVAVLTNKITDFVDVVAVDYGSLSLTQALEIQYIPDISGRFLTLELWTGALPPGGAQTVSVDFSPDGNFSVRNIGCVTYIGGGITGGNTNSASAVSGATSSSIILTGGDSDAIVIDATQSTEFTQGFPSPVAGVGQTERWEATNVASSARVKGSTKVGAASATMAWSWNDASAFAHVAVMVSAVVAAPGPAPTGAMQGVA